jgi:hypothetical protein
LSSRLILWSLMWYAACCTFTKFILYVWL